MAVPTLTDRRCGVLLHPTSLPGPGTNGDLGSGARRFLEFLVEAGQSWWQMLPVGPTGYGNSPYSALSAFAGNPALVSLERLRDEELIDGDLVRAPREQALRTGYETFRQRGGRGRESFEAFREASRAWLDDFTLYRALKRAHGEVQWTLWDPALRDRRPEAIERARRELANEMAFYAFEQHRFHLDWLALRSECNQRGVGLIGDIPIFVAHDSADVWQHRELFHLDDAGNPTVIAGVPPDYFSATGQRWGNPLYRWSHLRKTGYAWWLERFRTTLARFDAVRLDHFIGFQRYWEIPASEPTAQRGRWMKGPGADFFARLKDALGTLPLIAEDLGAVTPAVTRLRRQFGLPGIRLLQFAFGTDPQAPLFLPHNHHRHEVVYTGTHDNDTTVGWFHDPGGPDHGRSPEQADTERQAVLRYLGQHDHKEIHWAMMRALYSSVANLALVPLQDVLGLGSEARMNRPGIALGNWAWRFDEGALTTTLARRLAELTSTYGRGSES